MENNVFNDGAQKPQTKRPLGWKVISASVLTLAILVSAGTYLVMQSGDSSSDTPPTLGLAEGEEVNGLQGFIGVKSDLPYCSKVDNETEKCIEESLFTFTGFEEKDLKRFEENLKTWEREKNNPITLKSDYDTNSPLYNGGVFTLYSESEVPFEKLITYVDPEAKIGMFAVFDASTNKYITNENDMYVVKGGDGNVGITKVTNDQINEYLEAEEKDEKPDSKYMVQPGQAIYLLRINPEGGNIEAFANDELKVWNLKPSSEKASEVYFNIESGIGNGYAYFIANSENLYQDVLAYYFSQDENGKDYSNSIFKVWVKDGVNWKMVYKGNEKNKSINQNDLNKLKNVKLDGNYEVWVKFGDIAPKKVAPKKVDQEEVEVSNKLGKIRKLTIDNIQKDQFTAAWISPENVKVDKVAHYNVKISSESKGENTKYVITIIKKNTTEKIEAIKKIRAILELGLKEAKDTLESGEITSEDRAKAKELAAALDALGYKTYLAEPSEEAGEVIKKFKVNANNEEGTQKNILFENVDFTTSNLQDIKGGGAYRKYELVVKELNPETKYSISITPVSKDDTLGEEAIAEATTYGTDSSHGDNTETTKDEEERMKKIMLKKQR
jgi:ribosomal protein L7/L12